MSMKRGNKIDRGYATVVQDDGSNYRTISEQMTARGYKMNHSSARNYVLRAMEKFASKLAVAQGMPPTEALRDQMMRSPMFQSAVQELLQQALGE